MNPFTQKKKEIRNQCQYWILAAVYRCCSWCTAWNRCGRNFSCFVARWALVTNKHFACPEILLPVCVLLLSYSVLPCQDTALLNASRTAANDFDANNIREWTHVLFALAQLLRNWREQRPSNEGDLYSSVTGEVGRVCYTWVDLLLISFL
jgi:hypothetical protein